MALGLLKTWLSAHLARVIKDERGQGMVEYGLIIALVAIGVIAVLGTLGDELVEVFNRITGDLDSATQQP